MMKCIAILSIMAVFLSGQVLSREHILDPITEPLASRSFGLFNLFNQNKDASSTRLTNLESAVAPIISGFANLQNQLAAAITRLTAAEGLIAQIQASIAAILTRLTTDEASIAAQNTRLANAEKTIAELKAAATPAVATCPAKAPTTAQIVMGICYNVFSTPLTFANAQAVCIAGSGKLAEPAAATATALYTALKTPFQTQTTTIGTNGAWIGVVQASGGGTAAASPFFFASSSDSPIAATFIATTPAPAAAAAGVNSVAFLATPNALVAATPFTAIDTTPTANVPTKGFICQY